MRHTTGLDLTDYNSYKVKATCANAFFPESEEDLQYIHENRKKIPKVILGSGHNVILSKDYYDDDFVIFSENFNGIKADGRHIEAEAGTSLAELSQMALANSLAGLEVFYDIPGSLGGAVVMNAGASGEEIKDVLIKARYYDIKSNKFHEKDNREINFEYRKSYFQKNTHLIVTKVWLQLRQGKKTSVKEKMDCLKEARWAKQPREYPNAGSVFKRPHGSFVGRMIDELGLKGLRTGGAQISEKHSGFIINTGNATGHDILNLIKIVRAKVKESFNVELEIEQKII